MKKLLITVTIVGFLCFIVGMATGLHNLAGISLVIASASFIGFIYTFSKDIPMKDCHNNPVKFDTDEKNYPWNPPFFP